MLLFARVLSKYIEKNIKMHKLKMKTFILNKYNGPLRASNLKDLYYFYNRK